MKLKFLIGMLFVISFLFSQPSFSANEFLNSNQECEAEAIVSNGYSVACKNYTSNLNNEVSFTGGIYPDCAIAASTTEGIAGTPNASVFLNKGTGATACTNSGDQFNSAANYILSGIDGSNLISTLVAGKLTGDSFSDIGVRNNDFVLRIIASAESNGAVGTINPATTNKNWFTAAGQSGISSSGIERSIALLDCDNDGDLDNATAFIANSSWGFDIMLNDGSGLQNASLGPYGTTEALVTPSLPPSLAVADFNNDGATDVVMSIGDNGSSTNKIVVCLNDKNNITGKGMCTFTNCFTQNVENDYTTPGATSIVAGDFDGDGNADVAINAPGFGGPESIIYYFGNGQNAFAFSATKREAVTNDGTAKVLTTGCFNADNIVDVAVSVNEGGTGSTGYVNLFELNPARVATKVELNFTDPTLSIGGIDAADFDRGGRDDILVTGTDVASGQRRAYIFMNAGGGGLPTAAATILSQNILAQKNTPIHLTGQCSMTDGSVSDFTYQWTITSPNAASATLTNATTLTPTFTPTESGSYVIQLTCNAVCGSVSNSTVTAFIYPASDQGGCVRNSLSPLSGPMNFSGLLPLLAPAGIWLARRKKAQEKKKGNYFKKIFLFVSVFILFGMFSKFSQATTSFQTNFFKPVIDDSEYFTVYSSPLMKKNYYHAGFYIDYAHHPYEFGDASFNRTSGAVNHLLTGSFVGSYAIFDWLNIGGRLPVYFWDGIRAPVLNRPSENRIDLGDFAMELKFKLIDRKDHPVGWSLIPFMTVPSATHAVRDFTGSGTLTGGVKTVIDGKPHDRVSVSLNVGYEARDNVITPGGNRIDDHFLLGAGVSGEAIKEKLKVIAETEVETVTKDFFSKRRTTPAEGRLGFRYMFKNGVDVNAGGGMGYTNGIASPDFRVFAGVTYTKRPIAKVAIKEDVGEVGIGDELKLADKIYFEFDKAEIRSISQPTLDKAAAFIKAHPEIKKLRVEGHTCDLGTAPYNQKLSERRANAVVEYLVSQGISRSILHPVGYGKTQPAVPNMDESHREQNRRVQFFVEEK